MIDGLIEFCIIFLVASVLALIPIYTVGRISCSDYKEVTGRETQFKLMGGCFVKSGAEWFTKKEYRNIIIAREGLKNN